MTGKTHLSVGIAATLLVTQPSTIKTLVLGIGLGAVGSAISDIDVSTSESHEELNKILILVLLVAVATGFIEYKWNIGLISSFRNNSNFMRLFIGIGAFLVICAFGKDRPHRSFMHSILAVVMLCGTIYSILPEAVPYFAIAMSSHIIIDTLNRRKVLILYPIPWGIGLGLCHAKGFVNNTIFRVASIVAVITFIFLAGKIGVSWISGI
jgi:inner membrane protein